MSCYCEVLLGDVSVADDHHPMCPSLLPTAEELYYYRLDRCEGRPHHQDVRLKPRYYTQASREEIDKWLARVIPGTALYEVFGSEANKLRAVLEEKDHGS